MKVGTLVTPDSQKGKQEHKRRRTKEGKPEKHTMNCRRLILESTMEIIEASGSQPGAVLHHPPQIALARTFSKDWRHFSLSQLGKGGGGAVGIWWGQAKNTAKRLAIYKINAITEGYLAKISMVLRLRTLRLTK